MLDLDMNLRLLSGKPIEVNGIKIYPATLGQMVDVTIEKYYRYVDMLCIDETAIKKLLDSDKNTVDAPILINLTPFKFIFGSCINDEGAKKIIFDTLYFFLREQINLWGDGVGFCVGDLKDRIIDEDVFNKIIKIIKLQNCLLSKQEEEEFRPANEKARQMLEQMKRDREELRKAKSKSDLDLCDLISIFAAYANNTNILNVWDLTFYQFDDQFNRLKIMKEYDVNLQILMHCDTSKNKIDLKHWFAPSLR